jgi:hypothetical protein
MALLPKDMDGFLSLLVTTDTRIKLTVAMNLINYLGDPSNSIECSDIGHFIACLVPWMQSSNSFQKQVKAIFKANYCDSLLFIPKTRTMMEF